MAKRILITGASGFLGWHLVTEMAARHQLIGTYCRQHYAQNLVDWRFINLLNINEIAPLMREIGEVDAIIHTAGIANMRFCENFPALSHNLNVYATMELAKEASQRNIPFIFTSTDLVFNGSDAPYSELSFPYPISRYGSQKAAAEDALLTDFSNTMVVRLPLMFGWGAPQSQHFFKDWTLKLRQKQQIQAFTDEFRTPISGAVAAAWIARLAEWAFYNFQQKDVWDNARLLHLGGNERISRYDFACKMATALDLDTKYITPALRQDVEMGNLRPADVSLDNELACELLQFQVPTLDAQLKELSASQPNWNELAE